MAREKVMPFGVKKYRELSGSAKHAKQIDGKRILNIEGIATAVGDVDEAIRTLRKSRMAAVSIKSIFSGHCRV